MTADPAGTASTVMLVIGSVRTRPETLEAVRTLSLTHVQRSREEPGCLAHGVHQDLEDPLRLVFVEAWADLAALRNHFAMPAARAFVAALRTLAAEPPTMQIYQASPAQP